MLITYAPAFDAYHGIFRIFLLLRLSNNPRIEVDRIKIVDFYFCFPRAIDLITRTRGISNSSIKKVLDTEPVTHAKMPSPKILYRRTEAVTEMALRSLIALGFLDRESFLDGWVSRTSKPVPEHLSVEIEKHILQHVELCRFISERLYSVPLYGPRGMKAITNLIEYRYDNY